MKKNITGIILAGGKNLRMGRDKAFLELDEVRLIDKIIGVFKELFSEIIIVTNNPLAYAEFAFSVIVTDIYQNKGPLGGIYSGLFFASENYSFVTACDMPFLNKDLITYLCGKVGKYDIIIPETTNGFQPLHAVYSKNCLEPIKKNLISEELKITNFFKKLRVLTVSEKELNLFNDDGQLFLNVNTPKDLKLIKNKH